MDKTITPEISIAIPTYEMNNLGVQYLSELFNTINLQTFRNFEICISDHSRNDSIFNLCENYAECFTIQYFRNESKRGNGPANTNSAIEMCNGKITKIMFQDDLFLSKNALKIINDTFNNHCCNWCFNGFAHTVNGTIHHRPMIPRWCDMMLHGRNLLGSPSAVSFLTNKFVGFDEKLVLLMDTDFYYRMRKENGEPFIIEEYLVSNREHPNRISSLIKYDKLMNHPEGSWMVNEKELNYVLEKNEV